MKLTNKMIEAALNNLPNLERGDVVFALKAMLSAAPTQQAPEISKEVIRIIALQYGFKLKEQPDGREDLNPYVYDFARKLINMASDQVASAAPTPPVVEPAKSGHTEWRNAMFDASTKREEQLGLTRECFTGDCHHTRAEAALRKAPPQPKVPAIEPVAVVDRLKIGNIFWTTLYLPKDGTELYTSPLSHKASWDADGNPLNLEAAARDFYAVLDPDWMEVREAQNLRKFLPEGK